MNVFWSDIERRFFKLHSEQRSANGLVHAINCDDSWTLGGPEDLQKKFRSIVRNIAVRLGWANDKDPLSVWCELLKRHGVGYREMTVSMDRRRFELDTEQMCSIEREQRDTQGGTINLLCKVSAEYCIECDTKKAAAAKATAVGRQIFVAANSGKIAQAESRSNKHSKPLDDREQKIWEVIHRGARGMVYCRELDAARVSPPRKGIWKEGPRTYTAGYQSRDKKLVHWIQNEKSKIRRKAELAGHTETRTKLARE
jgi:hypothetical protein